MASKKGAAWSWRRLALGAACVAGLGGAGYVGSRFLPRATAQPAAPVRAATPAANAAAAADYNERPVAFLHGNESVTREQLGEYLIARYGAEKLPLLVNKIIIEEACKAHGIDVTPAEVEAAYAADLASMNMDEKTFVNGLLKQCKKSLYEWKEDVVRPKLLMTKLVRDRVKVTEAEIQACYDAHYGEMVDCRFIYWPKTEQAIATKVWGVIHDSKDPQAEFDKQAMRQADPNLAAHAGDIGKPIGRNTVGDSELERMLFSMQPGDISPIKDTRDGIVVVKCVKRIPAQTFVSLESKREELQKEVFDKKVQMEIPKVFAELQQQARVNLLLKDGKEPTDLTQTTQELLQGDKAGAPSGDVVPASHAH